MCKKAEKARPKGWVERASAVVALLVALTSLLGPPVRSFYEAHIVDPKIQCTVSEDEDFFQVSEDYRAVSLHLRPQIVVKFENHVILCICLKNYYEDEVVSFDGTSGGARKKNRLYVDTLRRCIKDGILKDIKKFGPEAEKRAEMSLEVYESLLGGIEYQNWRGNHIKKLCIIGKENLIQDYSEEATVISHRLNDMELETAGDPTSIAQDKGIERIVYTASDTIYSSAIGKTAKNWFNSPAFFRLPTIFYWGLLLCAAILGVFVCVVVYVAVGAVAGTAANIIVHLTSYLKGIKAPGAYRCLINKPILRFGLLCAVLFPISTTLVSVAVDGLTATDDERYLYETTDLVEQKPTSILFQTSQPSMETDDPLEEDGKGWPLAETLERLHIYQNYTAEGSDISQEMLESYQKEFSRLYRNGSKQHNGPVLPKWLDLSRDAYQELDGKTLQSIQDEAGRCGTSHRPASLYQLFRALADAVYMEHSSLPFEDLFDIAADAVACGELFLTYEDREIEDSEKTLIINAEDVALMNGKIYWILASCLEHGYAPSEYDIYRNCFYAAGFQCMVQGAGQAAAGADREWDPEYAKLLYYAGNFGEKMVTQNRIPSKDALYSQMGRDALRYYGEAERLLNGSGIPYREEPSMRNNITSGIATLEGRGFALEEGPDAPT